MDNSFSFKLHCSVRELERKLNNAYQKMQVESINGIRSTAQYAVSISGRTAVLSPFLYQVDIYIWADNGENVTLEIKPIGDGGSKFIRTSLDQEYGVYRELRSSKKKAKKLIELLGLKYPM